MLARSKDLIETTIFMQRDSHQLGLEESDDAAWGRGEVSQSVVCFHRLGRNSVEEEALAEVHHYLDHCFH